MHISNILTEVWTRGHQPQAKIIEAIRSLVGTRGKVTPVDRKVRGDKVEAKIEISYYDFIDIFCGIRGGIERVLSLLGTNSAARSSTTQSTSQSKAQTLTTKLFNRGIRNIREFMPSGWVVAGTHNSPPDVKDLLDTMLVLYIKRDVAELSPQHEKYYHVTLKANTQAILSQGLRPNRGYRTDFDSYANRIFMATSLENGLSLEFMVQLIGYNRQNYDITVFQIILPDGYLTYKDPQYSDYGVFGEQAIPSSALKIIYQGKMHHAPWVHE